MASGRIAFSLKSSAQMFVLTLARAPLQDSSRKIEHDISPLVYATT